MVTPITKTYPFLAVFLILGLALSVVVTQHVRLSQHTLDNNGNWESGKTKLAKRVFGARNFMSSRQALAFDRLDLGAWHGFQELFAQDLPTVQRLSFRFLLNPGAHISVLWGRHSQGYTGFRFSADRRFSNLYFQASPTHEFLAQETISVDPLPVDLWHKATLEFDRNSILVHLNQREIARLVAPGHSVNDIGFRGSLAGAFIDSVAVTGNGSITFSETFENPAPLFVPGALAFLIVGALNTLAFALGCWAFRDRSRQVLMGLLVINLVAVALGTLLYGYRYFGGSLYPRISIFTEQQETRWKTREAAVINKELLANYGKSAGGPEHRILVIGSSQTWGAGAAHASDVFTVILQRLLNAQSTHKRFVVMNGGISALRSSHLLDLYQNQWLKLTPDTVIINLGNNDHDADLLEENTRRMIEVGQQNDIQTVVVLEPNSIEHDVSRLLENHFVMRRLAQKYDIPYIEMHHHLSERYDEGFLWWDHVHMSSFGQKLFANKLYAELTPLLE